jgi:hypothetical protein
MAAVPPEEKRRDARELHRSQRRGTDSKHVAAATELSHHIVRPRFRVMTELW